MIIAEFDDIFGSRGNQFVKDLITESAYEDLFKTETTTSLDAKKTPTFPPRTFKLAKCPVYEDMKRLAKIDAQKERESAAQKETKSDGIKKAKIKPDDEMEIEQNTPWYYDFEKYPRQRPDNLRIDFWERHWENKIFFAIYRMIRFFHVTFWFYFFPFIAIVLTYIIPLLKMRVDGD